MGITSTLQFQEKMVLKKSGGALCCKGVVCRYEPKSLCKYTSVARGHEGVVLKSMINLVLA